MPLEHLSFLPHRAAPAKCLRSRVAHTVFGHQREILEFHIARLAPRPSPGQWYQSASEQHEEMSFFSPMATRNPQPPEVRTSKCTTCTRQVRTISNSVCHHAVASVNFPSGNTDRGESSVPVQGPELVPTRHRRRAFHHSGAALPALGDSCSRSRCAAFLRTQSRSSKHR